MRHISESEFESFELGRIGKDSVIARNTRARVGFRRVGSVLAVGALVLESACGAGGAVLDAKAKKAVMKSDVLPKPTENVSLHTNFQMKLDTEPNNQSDRSYCAPPRRLDDGTKRFEVQTSSTCPEQVVPIGTGWGVFDSRRFDFQLEGGAQVNSVVRTSPNSWIVDPK